MTGTRTSFIKSGKFVFFGHSVKIQKLPGQGNYPACTTGHMSSRARPLDTDLEFVDDDMSLSCSLSTSATI